MQGQRLGELLRSRRLVTDRELADALALQSLAGGLLGQLLIRLGAIPRPTWSAWSAKSCARRRRTPKRRALAPGQVALPANRDFITHSWPGALVLVKIS